MKVKITAPKTQRVRVTAASGATMDNPGGMPLDFTYGGGAKVISDNPYTPSPTIEFVGPSHADGGIGMQYGNSGVEVEGKETGFIDNNGDMNIMGNMKVPGMNKKFKNAMKDISGEENKTNKIISTAKGLADKYEGDNTKFGNIGTNTAMLMQLGADMKLKSLSQKKDALVDIQNSMLNTSNQLGIDPQAMSYGKIKKAKNGMTISKAQAGISTPPDPNNYALNYVKNKNYQNFIADASEKYGINPNILSKILYSESGFNPKAVSNAGAKGIAQFMPATAKEFGLDPNNLTSTNDNDVREQIFAAAHYLKNSLNKFNNDPILAVASYNGGAGAVENVQKNLGKKDITGQDLIDYYTKQRQDNPTNKPNAWQNQTLDYVNGIFNTPTKDYMTWEGNSLRAKYYGLSSPENPYPINPVPYHTINDAPISPITPDKFAPSIQKVYGSGQVPTNNIPQSWSPKPYESTPLSLSEIAPELYALGANRLQGVQGQVYTPRLYQPYQVSFQDHLNQNESSFRGVEQQLDNNPEALSTFSARKYQADQGVLGSEFRTNQQINNNVTNENIQTLNDANLRNLQLGDEQYVRQEQARANTQAQNNVILNSISSKVEQNRLANKEMAIYSNMFPYYYFDNSGAVHYNVPSANSVLPTFKEGGVIKPKRGKRNKSPNSSVVKLLHR